MLIVGNYYLFADAKILKDILEYHVVGYFTCYVIEVEYTFTNVL